MMMMMVHWFVLTQATQTQIMALTRPLGLNSGRCSFQRTINVANQSTALIYHPSIKSSCPDRSNSPLPKFGEWNLKNGGAGQYSMIFEKARNTKRSGGDEQDLRNSPRSRETVPLTKHEARSPKPSAHKRWLCCSNPKDIDS